MVTPVPISNTEVKRFSADGIHFGGESRPPPQQCFASGFLFVSLGLKLYNKSMIEELLKYTYLLDVLKIKELLEKLWGRYQEILDNKNSSWEDLNEARAILYFIGFLYPEEIAQESLRRRVSFLLPKITLEKFLLAVDGKEASVLNEYQNNKEFGSLRDFYLAIKEVKNRTKGNSYLDEERFNRIYSKLKPKNYF